MNPKWWQFESFGAWLEANVTPEPNTGCWLWVGAESAGYGTVGSTSTSARERVHRMIVEHSLRRSLVKGEWALHRCDNRLCCNPAHVYLGTPLANAADRIVRDRHKHTKLTKDLVVSVRARFNRGEKIPLMANELGLHADTIRKAINGTNWGHIK